MDGVLALDTIKSFKEIMSPEDYAEFLKSEDSEKLRAFPEVTEFLKGMDKEFQKEESDKKEDKEEHEAGESGKKEKKEEEEDDDEKDDDEKAITPELLKAFEDRIDNKIKTMTDMLSKSFSGDDKIEELQKSINDITEVVQRIAGMPLGTKALKNAATANFFEKAFGGEAEDDKGKKILSVTLNKEAVLKSLEDGMKKAVDAELIKSYEGSIIRYNGGGGTIAQEVALDLYENAGIRLVK